MNPPRVPIREFATQMRCKMTPAEDALYKSLLIAFRPYRCSLLAQEVLGPYVADFCILPRKLIIEVDGSIHYGAKQIAHDKRRDTYLNHRGYMIKRYKNLEVIKRTDQIAQAVLEMCLPMDLKAKGEVKITYCPPMRASNYKMRLM